MYGWFERNAELLAVVLRDAEHNAVVREVSRTRYGPRLAAWDAALADAEGGPAEAAMLALALSYHTWRTLARDRGLGSAGAADAMVSAVAAAASAPSAQSRPAAGLPA